MCVCVLSVGTFIFLFIITIYYLRTLNNLIRILIYIWIIEKKNSLNQQQWIWRELKFEKNRSYTSKKFIACILKWNWMRCLPAHTKQFFSFENMIHVRDFLSRSDLFKCSPIDVIVSARQCISCCWRVTEDKEEEEEKNHTPKIVRLFSPEDFDEYIYIAQMHTAETKWCDMHFTLYQQHSFFFLFCNFFSSRCNSCLHWTWNEERKKKNWWQIWWGTIPNWNKVIIQ